ncbi:hypothetical protein DICVIV_03824 [Dictyocaulus viviparus]|uniref:Uncharacterized protein n=1 Tax=Dictyocaulus viviparus TaxID=29172 RepID=A0A0D8XZD1_DICVI|nr:hypothetical protein DICVIV_03824 [Dictyocaulus viviparus]
MLSRATQALMWKPRNSTFCAATLVGRQYEMIVYISTVHEITFIQDGDWSGSRTPMWTTVFEGDESEQPFEDVVRSHSLDDHVLDSDTDVRALNEVEFDNTMMPSPLLTIDHSQTAEEISTPLKMLLPPARSTPEITITADDEKIDSEDEESGSEDDDEYPDKVVAAPMAPNPTYEEVEQECQKQEQFGKEVLQQIQAFGEAANDEFDVQWAKTTLQKTRQQESVEESPIETSGPSICEIASISNQNHDIPLEIAVEEERKNPFLESPEDEDVAVDMEEMDICKAAQLYQTQSLFSHRPGPVYTIPEDANECDGTIENSDSRMIAREKKRQTARSVTNLIIGMYDQTAYPPYNMPTASRTSEYGNNKFKHIVNNIRIASDFCNYPISPFFHRLHLVCVNFILMICTNNANLRFINHDFWSFLFNSPFCNVDSGQQPLHLAALTLLFTIKFSTFYLRFFLPLLFSSATFDFITDNRITSVLWTNNASTMQFDIYFGHFVVFVSSPSSAARSNTVSDVPPSIGASIDKTMADIESLVVMVFSYLQ